MTMPHRIHRRFLKDDGGSILTVWAIALGIFLGIIALSYDFGRLATTQSDLQSFADNVALAAAGELDGQDDAITRAMMAASTFITDQQTFGEGEALLSGADDYTLTFFPSRPDDAGSVSATTNPRIAGFVRVDVPNQTVTPILGAAFAALTGQTAGGDQAAASAVAGYTQYACDIAPLMFCAPSADFRADENIGASVQLRTGGQGAGWGPGAFGWLDVRSGIVDPDGTCAGLNGARLDVCLIAAQGNTTSCLALNGVDIQGGQRVGNYEAAVNVLFDIYAGTTNQLRNNSAYAPAGNVRSSYVPRRRNCIGNQPALATDRMGLPKDDCHGSGACGRYGDGDWSQGRTDYVNVNFGGTDPFPGASTRYEYYQAELEAMASLPTRARNGNLNGLSPLEAALARGFPQCSNHVAPEPSRRTMVAASIDCVGEDISAGSTNVPVIEFVEVFLLSPVGQDGTRDIWIEIVGGVGGDGGAADEDAMFRDVVVLYD